jgi:hypothetical protein
MTFWATWKVTTTSAQIMTHELSLPLSCTTNLHMFLPGCIPIEHATAEPVDAHHPPIYQTSQPTLHCVPCCLAPHTPAVYPCSCGLCPHIVDCAKKQTAECYCGRTGVKPGTYPHPSDKTKFWMCSTANNIK